MNVSLGGTLHDGSHWSKTALAVPSGQFDPHTALHPRASGGGTWDNQLDGNGSADAQRVGWNSDAADRHDDVHTSEEEGAVTVMLNIGSGGAGASISHRSIAGVDNVQSMSATAMAIATRPQIVNPAGVPSSTHAPSLVAARASYVGPHPNRVPPIVGISGWPAPTQLANTTDIAFGGGYGAGVESFAQPIVSAALMQGPNVPNAPLSGQAVPSIATAAGGVKRRRASVAFATDVWAHNGRWPVDAVEASTGYHAPHASHRELVSFHTDAPPIAAARPPHAAHFSTAAHVNNAAHLSSATHFNNVPPLAAARPLDAAYFRNWNGNGGVFGHSRSQASQAQHSLPSETAAPVAVTPTEPQHNGRARTFYTGSVFEGLESGAGTDRINYAVPWPEVPLLSNDPANVAASPAGPTVDDSQVARRRRDSASCASAAISAPLALKRSGTYNSTSLSGIEFSVDAPAPLVHAFRNDDGSASRYGDVARPMHEMPRGWSFTVSSIGGDRSPMLGPRGTRQQTVDGAGHTNWGAQPTSGRSGASGSRGPAASAVEAALSVGSRRGQKSDGGRHPEQDNFRASGATADAPRTSPPRQSETPLEDEVFESSNLPEAISLSDLFRPPPRHRPPTAMEQVRIIWEKC